MEQTRLLALTLLAAAFVAQSPLLVGQDDSKARQDAEPIYHIGGGVTAPKVIYAPDPEYDDASRKAKLSGTVVLSVVVTKEGRTRDVKVVKSLSRALDKQAIAAVSRWTFTPATKDGEPVAVELKVETSFRIR